MVGHPHMCAQTYQCYALHHHTPTIHSGTHSSPCTVYTALSPAALLQSTLATAGSLPTSVCPCNGVCMCTARHSPTSSPVRDWMSATQPLLLLYVVTIITSCLHHVCTPLARKAAKITLGTNVLNFCGLAQKTQTFVQANKSFTSL